MTEHFAHIKIDEPKHSNGSQGGQPSGLHPHGLPAYSWDEGNPALRREEGSPRPDIPITGQKPEGLKMTDGDLPIQSYTLKNLCETLGIPLDSRTGRRRDRELLTALDYRLYRQGLRMGRYIIGKAIPKPDEQLYVYPHKYGEPPKRGTVAPSMFLVAWLVAADGVNPRDLDIIDQWLVKTLGSTDQAIPAIATIRWLTHRKLILTAWRKNRCESLSKFVHRRASLVNLLLTLVADGPVVSPQRLARLETIYRLIGLDPADIHSDLHRLSTSGRSIQNGSPGKTTLSQQRLNEMAADTAKAQAILSHVFADEPEPSPTTSSKNFENSREPSKALDVSTPTSPFLSLLRGLMDRPTWSRADFERLARDHRHTPGALLEALNDLAYDTVGDPVAEEDDDTILIDIPVAQEIMERMTEDRGENDRGQNDRGQTKGNP